MRLREARTLREMAEVAAILIAGIWAFYVFLYENRIRPAFEPPTPSISVEMRHVGNNGDLAVVELNERIRNPGPAEVHFLGYSVTVLASKVVEQASPAPARATGLTNVLEPYASLSRSKAVYRDAFVTEQGSPLAHQGLYLEPGQTTTFEKEFYVPRLKFDHLTAWVVAAYLRSAQSMPTSMRIRPNGVADFQTTGDAYRIAAPLYELDLRGQ